MVIKNAKIVLLDRIIENGYVRFENGVINEVKEGPYLGEDESLDAKKNILMPGFIDIHIHGSSGIDFMDATVEQYKTIESSLNKEGVTTFLATTLTSDPDSLLKVAKNVKEASKECPSLGGIHLEGPYISSKYKGAQNESYIRNPDVKELESLIKESGNNIRYISMAPEKDNAIKFIKYAVKNGVVVSAGHTDATFDEVEEAIEAGLSNTTHTHNAMSGHHHRNPGVLTAAMYDDRLFTEVICDKIHVCPNSLKTFYKVVGPNRFIIITDALKAKNSKLDKFELFGLPCEKKNGAAYLTTGPLAGSLLNMDEAVRNMYELVNPSLIDLAKISSYNAAKSLNFTDRGEIKEGKLADFVLLNNKLNVIDVYKLGKKVN